MNAHRTAAPLWTWLPVVVLPVATFGFRPVLPDWAFMWALALSLFLGCKWLTLNDSGTITTRARAVGYLAAWPGMDARAFLERGGNEAPAPATREWLAACAKLLGGVLLLWVGVRAAARFGTLAAGWVGMVGVIFILHFGTFHLASLAWRRRGVRAEPIMNAPLCATSLRELWGRRWNGAFHELVHRYAFRPWHARFGAAAAVLGVFVLSGLIHELVITVPARGGYGGPTAYFALNGLGVLAERTALGRRLGLVAAGALMPRTVGLRRHLAPLPPFIRRLFWVYYVFIGLSLVSFGTLTFVFAPELAAGDPLARGLCWFLTVFWGLRLLVAAFVFDVRPYLTSWVFRAGYHVTNTAFGLLVVLYAWLAVRTA